MSNRSTDHEVKWVIQAKAADGRRVFYAGDGAFIDELAWAVKFPTKKAAELRSYGLADWNEVETVEMQHG